MFIVQLLLMGNSAKKFGEELKLDKSSKISVMLETPEKFLKKTVRIEGMVTGVCKMRGCWMDIASDKEFQKLKIKVKDGDMVFPLTAKGKYAVAEGTLYKISLTKKQVIEMKKHQAKEHGTKFDPDSVKSGMTFYQFKPVGVVIKNKK